MIQKYFMQYFVLVVLFIVVIFSFLMVKSSITGRFILEDSNNISLNLSNDVTEDLNQSSEEIVSTIDGLKIKHFKVESGFLNLSYDFDNSNYIGESITLEVLITNSSDVAVKKDYDVFSIRRNGLINREMMIDVSGFPTGVYNVYIGLLNYPEDKIKQKIVIGQSKNTANVIGGSFSDDKKFIFYVLFVLFISGGFVFVIRRHRAKKRSYGNS